MPSRLKQDNMRRTTQQLIAALWLILLLAGTTVFAEDAFFVSGGVKLHYTVQGQGEPVILIHGFGANIEMNWVMPGVLPALTQSYKVIALDNRGHGQSEKPTKAADYGIKFVDDVVALMDHLKLRKAHVVGYSMGGFITDKLLVTHPDRLLTATLGGAGWSQPDDDRSVLNALAESLEQGKGIGPLVTLLTPKGEPPPTEERIQAASQMLLAFNDPKVLAAVARSMDAFTVTKEQLRSNRVPVLALIGEKDPLKAGVDKLDGALANLKIVVIPGANHMSAMSDPAFLSSLKSFLAEHPAEAAKKPVAAGPK
jgi:pimeloyl-ACP methyl ester carboxylesterase